MGFRDQKVKKEHSILSKGMPVLEALAKAPGVTRVIPGRISRGRGGSKLYFTVQYRTESGFKLILHTASTQEIFVVTNDPDATEKWLTEFLPKGPKAK